MWSWKQWTGDGGGDVGAKPVKRTVKMTVTVALVKAKKAPMVEVTEETKALEVVAEVMINGGRQWLWRRR